MLRTKKCSSNFESSSIIVNFGTTFELKLLIFNFLIHNFNFSKMRRISKTPQLRRNFAATSPQLLRNFSAKLLTVLFIFLTSTLFWSCKKEGLPESSNTTAKTNLVSSIITVETASTFFKEKFGDEKLASLHSLPTSVLGDTVMYIPSGISIKPKWSNAEISTLLKVNPILVVPVEHIPELDSNKSGYSLVFYCDSIGHIQSVLKCYVPTIEYDIRVKGKYSATDFTGYMYEITMDSKIRKVIKLKNGKILGELAPNNLKSVGFRDDNPCYSFGLSWWDRIGSFFSSIGNAIGGFFGDSGISSNDPTGGGSNYSPTSSSSGYDGTLVSYGGGSSAIINQGNQNNLPGNIYDATTLKSGLIAFGISEFDYNYYIQQHPELETEILNFIVTRGRSNTNQQAVLNEYQSLDAATLIQYFNLLATNNDFYNTSKDAGFPKVGDDDWILNVAVLTLSQDPFSPAEKIAEFYYQYTSLKTQCPTCSKAKLGFQAFWNVEKDLIQGALSICGMIPLPVGVACNVANGIIYYMDGQGTSATLSVAAAVPFGVVLQKGVWAMRILTNGVEHSLVYSKTATGLIEFGNRSVIATTVKATTVGNEIHHLIPWGKRVENLVQKAAEVGEDGTAFHMNHPGNGIELTPFRLDPNIVVQGVHANHPEYDKKVVLLMNDEWKRLVLQYGSESAVPAKVAREKLIGIQNLLRDLINNNPGVKINDLVF